MLTGSTSFFRHGKPFWPLFFVMMLLLSTHTGQVLAQAVVQPTDEALATLDRRIRGHMAEFNIPGAVVAVASRGEILHLETYGYANVELAVPVSDSSVFEIGSISKQFVAVATLMNVEEGKLGLDDPIHKFLPDLPGEWLGATVRHLLTHTSGIPDYETIRSYDVYRFRLLPEDVIRIAHGRPMDFAPGEGYYYSNTGYYLLSMIVERIEGKPINQVLQTRIFEPLGMTQTRMADPEAIIPHRAAGYWVNRVGALINRNQTENSSTLAAGGLLSSVHDLIKWDNALYGDCLVDSGVESGNVDAGHVTQWRKHRVRFWLAGSPLSHPDANRARRTGGRLQRQFCAAPRARALLYRVLQPLPGQRQLRQNCGLSRISDGYRGVSV